MRRWFGIGMATVLVVGVVFVAVAGRDQGTDEKAAAGDCGSTTIVRGVVGSEKSAFFADPRVRDAFATHCLVIKVDPAGSREIATTVDLDRYQFAFPSSSPAAEKLQRARSVQRVYTPFSSPMAVATFAPIVRTLTAAGVVRRTGTYSVLDMAKYLDLVARGVRWDALPGNTDYPARKSVLVTTTDPRSSNSAAMYAAIASYVLNGDAVVQDKAAEKRVLPTLSKLFLGQGYTDNSTEGPFEDYLATGIGKTPLVMIYEAQYVARLNRADGAIRPDMTLIYPSPTVLSKHTLVPLAPAGDQVGELLTSDPTLTALAAEHGYRTASPGAFRSVLDRAGPAAAPIAGDLVDVVEPPAYETSERLLNAIADAYNR
ncbi:hypothetical protein [Cryptosporangium aurantiacum]|uniref:Extracellular solute-binding protein n=1 Tax=Cryptosporangium aurantiacum TaxID=134849 RepID=A0A1M7RPN7_9ACTN|nr:hypothetical protein [Cryptosporangium aurantiacum]SHN48121.1 hypothetical protein SAMN05443668_13418 [Cryptosporangium aurantiacum]